MLIATYDDEENVAGARAIAYSEWRRRPRFLDGERESSASHLRGATELFGRTEHGDVLSVLDHVWFPLFL